MQFTTPMWFNIAKAEYTVHINKIPRIKRIFPYLAIGGMALYIFFIAPMMVDVILKRALDEIHKKLVSYAALALVEVFLFTLFLNFMLIPLSFALKDIKVGQTEIFLASPVNPGDVILGEFIGKLPFYSIFAISVLGVFTAVLDPLGMDVFQTITIVGIFLITLFSAYWIGTVIAAYLRTRLEKFASGKDIGKALATLVVLPAIGLLYFLMSPKTWELILDKSGTVEFTLGFFPSSWGARIVVEFAKNPGDISGVWSEVLMGVGSLVVFFILILYVGTKITNYAYSLEPSSFSSSTVKQDGIAYNTVRKISGQGSFGVLLVTNFLDFFRHFESISKLLYILGLYTIIMFILTTAEFPIEEMEGMVLIYPLVFTGILASMINAEMTLRGKENLLIYRKAPNGIHRLICVKIIQGMIMIIPLTVLFTIIPYILGMWALNIDIIILCIAITLTATANIIISLSIYLLLPAYSDKDGAYVFNIMFLVNFTLALFIISLTVLENVYIIIPILWICALILLPLGVRKFSRLE